jgi:hypothetical protein
MLPILISDSRELNQMQTQWASSINPLLSNPLSSGVFVKQVSVVSGSNSINHKLGRKPLGWFVTNINAAITLYMTGSFDPLFLRLTASGSAAIDLYVF